MECSLRLLIHKNCMNAKPKIIFTYIPELDPVNTEFVAFIIVAITDTQIERTISIKYNAQFMVQAVDYLG